LFDGAKKLLPVPAADSTGFSRDIAVQSYNFGAGTGALPAWVSL